MRAGELNRRLSLDQPVTSQNDTGEEVTAWAERAKVWAEIHPLRGRESLIAGVNLALMDTRIRMRWTPAADNIGPKWRLRYKSITYDIVQVAHVDMGRREIEIMAKSGANLG